VKRILAPNCYQKVAETDHEKRVSSLEKGGSPAAAWAVGTDSSAAEKAARAVRVLGRGTGGLGGGLGFAAGAGPRGG